MDILIERADGVMVITLNRPQRKNALTAAMYQAMADALRDAETSTSERAIVIRGQGGSFSAGNDLEDFMQSPPSDGEAPVFQFLRRISSARKPIVAAVSGAAIGIGTTMLLHCDMVYAASTAKFALPFVQLGLCPEAASSLLLPRIAGYPRAAEKLLLGEPFDAAEALAMGLVNRVMPPEDVDAFAMAQAKKLGALPAKSLAITKALMKGGDAEAISQRIAEEVSHFGRLLQGGEAKEAFVAFFEKRKPDFSRFNG